MGGGAARLLYYILRLTHIHTHEMLHNRRRHLRERGLRRQGQREAHEGAARF